MPSGPLARGRPDADTQRWRHRMQQLLKRVTTDEDVLEVWDHVTDMAKNSGDIQWSTLFLAYTLGKPAASDPSQLSGLQVDGDLTISINQLSTEQLRLAQDALKTIDATFSVVDDLALAPATPHQG